MARHGKKQQPTIYTKLGYLDRYEYFEALADAFGLEVMEIIMAAERLGPEEDFNLLLAWASKEAKTNAIR